MKNITYNPAEEGIRAAKRDALPWTYTDGNRFRMLPPQKSMHNGQPVTITHCEEYSEGRWEGFVAICKLEITK